MQRHPNTFTSVVLMALVALLCAPMAWADVTGSILGIVRDSSQAIVVGATVVATNVETNFQKESTSGTDGQYRFLAMPVGNYKITATAPGFQQFTTTAVNLKVNDQLRIDVVLTVGNLQQAVSIEANAVQVNTESTQLGDVVETSKMVSLPLNGRSFLDLLGLQAGVLPFTAGLMPNDRPVSGMTSNPGNISVNGQRESQNAFLVNGGDVQEGKDNGAGLIPNLDSIAEFRLITSSFDAEYGRFGGGVMNAITKSGANGFHGAAFEYLRNDKMDARNFFDPSKAELRRNQFGYAVGGPFLKNKLFWFTDYQGTRQVTGASTGNVQLPTANQRQGIFSPSNFTIGGKSALVQGDYFAGVLTQRLGYTVTNGEPYSTAACATTAQCVFPGGVIPQKAFDKVSANLLQYIPLGNINPATGLFADAGQKAPVVDDKMGQRIDLNSQKTGNLSFYYHFDDSTITAPLQASFPGFSSVTPTRAQMFTLNDTRTFGPTSVNEFRASFFRTSTFNGAPGSGFASLNSLGFTTGGQGIIPSGPSGFPETVPPMYLNSFHFGPNSLTMYQANNTYMMSDGFSKIVGKHTFKFGGEFRYLQINVRNAASPNGEFHFDGSETGTDFADFLLGAPYQYIQSSTQVMDDRSNYGGVYGEDAWKIKPNLTFNIGLRWEATMPWADTQGRLNTIIPGVQSTMFPTAPKGYLVPGDPGVPSSIVPTRWNNVSPRLGLAWSPDIATGFLGKLFGGPGKTSIRAAFGMYYESQENIVNFGVFGDAPYGQYWMSPTPVMMDTPFINRSNGVSQGQRFPFIMPVPGSPANAKLDWTQFEPLLGPGYGTDNQVPYAEHYNLTIQRQLSKTTVMTLGYVGSQDHHLMAQFPANPGSAALCFWLNSQGATPTCGPHGELSKYTLPNGQVYQGTTTAFGPEFSTILQWDKTIGNSNYNALQVSVERKASDVTFMAAYTYSKSIDDSSVQGDYINYLNHRLSRALSAFDMTHNFVGSYNWAIPFNRALPALPRRLTQGWNISGITHLATGIPVKISQGSGDFNLTGRSGTDMPGVIGPVVTQDPRFAGPTGKPNTYFLPGSFISEPLGTIGNANRRFFHGPGYINTDFGVTKNVAITESKNFQVRAEFFNIFNHTNFNNPQGNFSSGQFGQVTTAKPPRIGQVSARFTW